MYRQGKVINGYGEELAKWTSDQTVNEKLSSGQGKVPILTRRRD